VSNWQKFFDGHAPQYHTNVFTRATLAEVDFLVAEIQLSAGCSILDMGCGTGRHSIELAKRGYNVTGVDLSSGMLAQAREAAAQAGVRVNWIQADATQFAAETPFDAAICLCEGAFGLVGDDADVHDSLILHNIARALKPRGMFMLTALNALQSIRQFTDEDVAQGRFDPLTLIETSEMEWETVEGKRSAVVREKRHLPGDLKRLVQEAGFEVLNLWGGTAGNWGRRPLSLDDIEVMIVAREALYG
jgi:2-polyprenyl-3-methyl-5-hydroxy-6-metoxy-1,4-benzoquinol methylase